MTFVKLTREDSHTNFLVNMRAVACVETAPGGGSILTYMNQEEIAVVQPIDYIERRLEEAYRG